MDFMSLFVTLLTFSYACWHNVVGSEGFTVVPESQTVNVSDIAIFRCRHPHADNIEWRVDGTPVSVHAPPEINPGFIRDQDGNLIDTLRIAAIPGYNNSEVVCVAKIGTQSVPTFPAILRVLPRITPPSVPPAGFTLVPESQNITLGARAQFTCQRRDGDVVWRINRQPVTSFHDVIATSQGGLHTLTITNSSMYNGSEIQCKAMFDDDSRREPEFTSPAILLLQGLLDSVRNVRVNRDFSTLSWTPPFSLDLTGVDLDIVYCVEVYNITCGRRDLIISDCNVTELSYTSDDITSDGYIYEYIVTPRSNVKGAKNGTPSQPLRERFSRFSNSLNKRKNIPTGNFQLTFVNSEPSRRLSSSYTVQLESLDGLENLTCKTTNVTTEDDLVVLEVNHRLPLNRLWNCTVLAYNCRQNTILSGEELSTHDIQDISVSSPLPGHVRVTGDFIQGSTATGVLVIIVNDSDIKHHLISKGSNENEVEGIISGLAGGQYTVSVFAVGKDGLPFERAATKPRSVSVENGSRAENPLLPIKYELQATSTGICITCTFWDSSTTDCMVVVHQRISQLSSSGLMNIESSHKFARSGETAYGCIEGVNSEDHQVGVIDGQLVIQQVSFTCTAGCIAGSVLAILFFVVVFVTTLIPVVLLRKYCRKPLNLAKQSDTKSSMQNLEEGSRGQDGNLYVDMPTSSQPIEVGQRTGEIIPLMPKTESRGPGETNEPQPDLHDTQTPLTSTPTSSSPVIPKTAATESTEETVASKEIEVDHHPNASCILPPSLDDGAQCVTVNNFENAQALVCEDPTVKPQSTLSQMVTPDDLIHSPQIQLKEETDRPEQAPSLRAPSPPTKNLPLFSAIASKEQPLDEVLPSDEDHTDNEKEVIPKENIKAISEDKGTEQLKGEADDTEMAKIEDEVKDNQTEEKSDSGSPAEKKMEVEESVVAENEEETRSQSLVNAAPLEHQVVNIEESSESGKAPEETTPAESQPLEESVSDDNSETTSISGNGPQLFPHKPVPVAQSTPVPQKRPPPNSVPDESDPDLLAVGHTSMFVQSLSVHKRKTGLGVTKSLTYIESDEIDAQNENSTLSSTPLPKDTSEPQAPGDHDSAYDTYSMPGDLDSHSVNEPYSQYSDIESGHETETSLVKPAVNSEIVLGYENTSNNNSFDDIGGKKTELSLYPQEEEEPIMGDHERVERFFDNCEDVAGPLVPSRHPQVSVDGTTNGEFRDPQLVPDGD